ncbi:hypothetical protein ACC692_37135, partial [Rhizobium ruizarguesonis]
IHLMARQELLEHVVHEFDAAFFAKKMVVLGPVAEYKSSLPRLLAHSLYERQPFNTADHLVPRQHIGLEIRDALAGSGAIYISTYKTMCNPD